PHLYRFYPSAWRCRLRSFHHRREVARAVQVARRSGKRNPGGTVMNAPLRQRCRNPHCRMKLPAPVENHHRAFCTRGCFESFYLSRCRVCERDLRKTGKRGDAHRLYCRPPNDCRSEARKWPEKYPATWSDVVRVGFCTTKLTDPHEIEAKTRLEGERLRHRALRHWSWHSDECE